MITQKTITRTKSLDDLLPNMPDAFNQDLEEAIQYEYDEMVEEAGIDEGDMTEFSNKIEVTISITYKTRGKKNG